MKTRNLGDADGLPAIEWSQVEAQLVDLMMHDDPRSPSRSTFWLTTLNVDGSPHVTSVGALWHLGSCWFQTGERTRKAKNVARDPRCSISVATKGLVAGEARRVTDRKIVAEIAALWAKSGCPARRLGNRHHRAVQRANARSAAVVRLRSQAAHRDRCRYRRRLAGFNALAVLKSARYPNRFRSYTDRQLCVRACSTVPKRCWAP
jgi:hypothetical protein